MHEKPYMGIVIEAIHCYVHIKVHSRCACGI